MAVRWHYWHGYSIFLIVMIGILFLIDRHRQQSLSYSWGRDTVDMFGDGRLQLLRGNNHIVLMDVKTQRVFSMRVHSWKRIKDKLYVVEKLDESDPFFVLDITKTIVIRRYRSLKEAPDNDKMVFEKLIR